MGKQKANFCFQKAEIYKKKTKKKKQDNKQENQNSQGTKQSSN